MELSADLEERKEAIRRARECGMDGPLLARRVAEETVERAFSVFFSLSPTFELDSDADGFF